MTSFTLQSQLPYDQMRMRGAELEGQAIGEIGTTAQNTVRYMQDLQIRKAESQAKLQAWEAERQISARKLQELMSVDMVEQSRLNIELLRGNVDGQNMMNESNRAKLDEQQEQKKLLDKGGRAAMFRTRLMEEFGDPWERAQQGMILDPDTMQIITRDANPAEFERQFGEMAKARKVKTESEAGNQGYRQMGAENNRLALRLKILDANAKEALLMNEQDQKQAMEQIQAERESIYAQLRGGPAADPVSGPTTGGGSPFQVLHDIVESYGQETVKSLAEQQGFDPDKASRTFDSLLAQYAERLMKEGGFEQDRALRTAYQVLYGLVVSGNELWLAEMRK